MVKTLSVSAIKQGTVIDHIPAQQTLKIVRLLHVFDTKQQVTVGLNLKSKRLGLKGLIKIENNLLSKIEIDRISVFAPEASINIIKDFEVKEKIAIKLPHEVVGALSCPNIHCITSVESVVSYFYLDCYGKHIQLSCKYCEKQFERDELVHAPEQLLRGCL